MDTTNCTLFIEDFKDTIAPGPFLLENFTCRKCGLIPADHNRKPVADEGNKS